MTENIDIRAAEEKAAEIFGINISLPYKVNIPIKRAQDDAGSDKLKICGINAEHLLNEPMSGISLTKIEMDNVLQRFNDIEDQAIVRACFEVNVDPNILIKQATLIAELRRVLDLLGNDYVGAPFSEYMKLREENARLRESICILMDRSD